MRLALSASSQTSGVHMASPVKSSGLQSSCQSACMRSRVRVERWPWVGQKDILQDGMKSRADSRPSHGRALQTQPRILARRRSRAGSRRWRDVFRRPKRPSLPPRQAGREEGLCERDAPPKGVQRECCVRYILRVLRDARCPCPSRSKTSLDVYES
jgi:hypothetical protein